MRRTPAERAEFVETRAEQMRIDPTVAESKLKELLGPLGFKFQVPIHGKTKNGGAWSYILDAYHRGLKLCVEADGGVHKKQKGRDRRRDVRLFGEGIHTLRLSNREVLKASELDIAVRISEFMAFVVRAE